MIHWITAFYTVYGLEDQICIEWSSNKMLLMIGRQCKMKTSKCPITIHWTLAITCASIETVSPCYLTT